jgi:hypothetical protein
MSHIDVFGDNNILHLFLLAPKIEWRSNNKILKNLIEIVSLLAISVFEQENCYSFMPKSKAFIPYFVFLESIIDVSDFLFLDIKSTI